ncbi:MAG: hypothetical protein RLN70_05935 [Rhodospirillaceae bacterium]
MKIYIFYKFTRVKNRIYTYLPFYFQLVRRDDTNNVKFILVRAREDGMESSVAAAPTPNFQSRIRKQIVHRTKLMRKLGATQQAGSARTTMLFEDQRQRQAGAT